MPAGTANPLPSLFVVGLPRSLSTYVHRQAADALGLRAPSWAGAGEVLNLDRSALHGGPGFDESRKYLTAEQHPARFGAAIELLTDVVRPFGRAYKDVVNPFVVVEWLRAHPMPTVVLERPLADVALAVLTNRWYYPASAAWSADVATDREGAVIEGLLRAATALTGVAGVRLAYDDLVFEPRALESALLTAYPDVELALGDHRDAAFVAAARRQIARRATPRHRALAARIEEVREATDVGAPPRPNPVVPRPFGRHVGESIRRHVCELLPQDATVGVVHLGAVELLHLEGRRSLDLDATDLRPDDLSHLLLARRSPDDPEAVAIAGAAGVPRDRLAGAVVVHEEPVALLLALG